MSQPIVPLSEILADAEAAAKVMAQTGVTAQCPWPPMSDAAARWHATVQRLLLWYSVGESAESSA